MAANKNPKRIKVCEDGPYIISGGIPLFDECLNPDQEGLSSEWQQGKNYPIEEEYCLCRCGHSKNKPFCDGSHAEFEFDGTETASHRPILEQAEPKTIGPELELIDVPALCASARFCDRLGGVWDNTRQSDNPKAKNIAIQEVADCPAGRLVLMAKNGITIEPRFEPSIGVVFDPVINDIGPLWVRGGIPIEAADGYVYEIRNRATLCRCGKSRNKPFCDGKHTEK